MFLLALFVLSLSAVPLWCVEAEMRTENEDKIQDDKKILY